MYGLSRRAVQMVLELYIMELAVSLMWPMDYWAHVEWYREYINLRRDPTLPKPWRRLLDSLDEARRIRRQQQAN
ncbi:MAG: hypothetical protein ACOYJ1_15700 [Peptococcales bacterium]|jgi:hypothetical protein